MKIAAMTNNHVSRNESMLGLIPAAIVFFLAFVLDSRFGERFSADSFRRVLC